MTVQVTAPGQFPVDIMLEGVIASFPNLWTAKKYKPTDDAGRFGLNLIFPDGYDFSMLLNAIEQAKFDRFGANPPANLKMPLKQVTDQSVPHIYGKWSAATYRAEKLGPPQVVDQNVQPLIDKSQLFAGAIVNASIRVYGYDEGITIGLNMVQLVRNQGADVIPIGSHQDATSVFKPIAGAPAAMAPVPGQQLPQGQATPGQPMPAPQGQPMPGQPMPAPQGQPMPGQQPAPQGQPMPGQQQAPQGQPMPGQQYPPSTVPGAPATGAQPAVPGQPQNPTMPGNPNTPWLG